MDEIVKVSNLSKTFKLSKKQQILNKTTSNFLKAVDNLSFSVSKGSIYGLLGSNGAGKTTTLRMLATLIKPDTGNINVCDIDAIKDPHLVRKKICFLTSDIKLDPFFTPDYLFTFFAKLYGLNDDLIKERKDYIFNKLQINDFKYVKFQDLSTGMKQKTCIAISLAHDPEVIIFDEPTNGLDIITAKSITDLLKELKNDGKTIILSTHIFSLVEKICDKVGIIIKGKLVCEDSVCNILKNSDLETYFFKIYENYGA